MTADSPDDLTFPVVDLPVSAQTGADSAIRFLVNELARLGQIHAEDVPRLVCELLVRESQGSTALCRGFALPHTKDSFIGQVVGIIGRVPEGMQWPGPDASPVREICVLLTPASRPAEGMRSLQAVVDKLRDGPWSGRI